MFGQSLLSGAFGGAACTTDTDQLFTSDVTATTIATYQLNGVTTSIPSNTYPGTASNITYAAGKFDNAAVFNGSSSLITLPDSSSISQENNFSLSFWIKPNGFVTYGTVFTFFSDYRNYVEISTGGIIRCNITGTTISAPSGSITNSVWQHVAITKSSTNGLVIYVNGSAVERNTSYTGNASDFRSSSYPNTIGAYKLTGSASDFFPGSMDQLRIFNTVLPQAAVTALYNETVATSSSADVNYQLANPNSIAYYKMSDATDQIGGNNLTNSNVNFNTEGKFGFAGKFNGSNSKLTISNSSFLPQGNNSRSISCWIKTTGGSSDGVIGYGNAVNSQAFVIYINNENKLGIFAYYNNTTGNIAISNNTWNHVVATYDGTNCRLYVNGVLDFTAAKTLNTGNGEFRIGGVNWNNSSEFFPGDIDQIRIYNSAISAANVTTLYEEIECPAATVINSFNTVLYTGNGGTNPISTVGFKPDFTWIKQRSGTRWHELFDSVRGVTKRINSNVADAQGTASTSLTSFDTNGFTLGSDLDGNESGQTFVAWNWKGGGTAVSNTDGTITSSVSANKEAGFSVVKYTGNEIASQTVGHGLSSKVEIAFIKQLDGSREWQVPLFNSTSGDYLILNDNDQKANDTARWSAVSSTTFTIGNQPHTNGSGSPYIAYCFTSISGYSRVGSYIGNGNANGPIINTGFQPAFVMIKKTSAADDWFMFDDKRSPTNSRQKYILANSANAEADYGSPFLNINANGFQPVTTSGAINSGDYIFLAIA